VRLIWRESALRDLERAMAYIAERNPIAAVSQLAEIERQVQRLTAHPRSGRVGRMQGTCELVVTRTPFVVVYTVRDTVDLIRVLHGAQQWPKKC